MASGVPLAQRRPSIHQDVSKAVRQWPGASIDDLQQLLPYHASYSELYSLVREAGEYAERLGSTTGLAVHYVGRKLHVFDAAISHEYRALGHVMVDDEYRAIIRYLKKNPNSKLAEIKASAGVTLKKLHERMKQLLAGGQVTSNHPPSERNPDTRYRLTPKMEECTDFPPFREVFMHEKVKTPEDYRRPC